MYNYIKKFLNNISELNFQFLNSNSYIDKKVVNSAFFILRGASESYVENGYHPDTQDFIDLLTSIVLEDYNTPGSEFYQNFEAVFQATLIMDEVLNLTYSTLNINDFKSDINDMVVTILSLCQNSELEYNCIYYN